MEINFFELFELVWICSLIVPSESLVLVQLLVNCDYTGTTKAEIVLQSYFSPFHLSLISHASQLPTKLSTLCESCRAERVSF